MINVHHKHHKTHFAKIEQILGYVFFFSLIYLTQTFELNNLIKIGKLAQQPCPAFPFENTKSRGTLKYQKKIVSDTQCAPFRSPQNCVPNTRAGEFIE